MTSSSPCGCTMCDYILLKLILVWIDLWSFNRVYVNYMPVPVAARSKA